MKTYNYKTAKGLINHTQQLTVEQFLNRQFYHNTGKWSNFVVSDSVNAEICSLIAKTLVKTKQRANDMFNSLLNCSGDSSLFQRFYIEIYNNEIIISNSLSGDAYNHCIHTYLKRYC